MVPVGIGGLVEIVTDSPTVALVNVLVLLVITEPPSVEAVVVIELDLVLRRVMVDPHVDILVVLGLLDAVVHVVSLLAVAVVVVIVGPVLAADPANEDGAPVAVVAVVAVVPSFVLATVVLSWPLLAVLSRNLFSSALTVVSSVTRRSSRASHLFLSASTD